MAMLFFCDVTLLTLEYIKSSCYQEELMNSLIHVQLYIYMYHFHTSDQRKASAYISHIALTQNVNEIYTLLPVRISR